MLCAMMLGFCTLAEESATVTVRGIGGERHGDPRDGEWEDRVGGGLQRQ